MQFVLDNINIAVLVVLVLNFSLGIFVFLTNRESKVNQHFFLFSISATLWGFAMIFYRSMAGLSDAPAFARILYASATTVPYSFLFFIRVFPEEKYNLPKKLEWYLLTPFLFVYVIALTPGLLIQGTSKTSGLEQIILFDSSYHLIFAAYIITYFVICYSLLFFKYVKFSGIQKRQITYVVVGTFIATIIGVSTNLLMPLMGDFSLNWLGQVGIITMVGGISYSILKHKLFNLKIVAAQFIVYALCVALLIRSLFSVSLYELVVNIVFFLIAVIIGSLLIQSVREEVAQREKVQKLASDLEHANERLKEVDQLKSEFLSLATHQIRAPLTAIKGYSSLILEGDYGEVPREILRPVDVISKSCQNLVMIVNDFLNISRIEQGRMIYELSAFDLINVTQQVITELRPNIEHIGLMCSCHVRDDRETVMVYADLGKVKQVIVNLVDNAIKYTPSGNITMEISKHDAVAQLRVSDTGIGIAPEDIKKLFHKFSRSVAANKTNVLGTGLGLYVAKQIIEAQKGKIWIESEGVGKGTTAIVELPLDTHVA